jgi:hypothetical protein
VLNCGDQVGPGAHGGIKYAHTFVCEGVGLAETHFKQLRDKPNLTPDDLRWGIVYASITSEARVVCVQEVFVEVQPEIALLIVESINIQGSHDALD